MAIRPDKRSIPTLAQAVDHYLVHAKAHVKDIKSETSVLLGSGRVVGKRAAGTALARTAHGGVRIDRIESWEFMGWFEDRHNGLSANSRRRGRATFRAFIDFCIAQGWMAEDMKQHFPALPKGDTDRHWLHPEQVVALVDLIDSQAFDDYDRFIFYTLLCTGVRPFELVKLKASDLDPREKSLTVLGKGRGEGKLRHIPVDDEYMKRWTTHVRRNKIRPTGWMFFHRQPRFLGGSSLAIEMVEDKSRHITQRPVNRMLAHEDGGDRRVCLQDLAQEKLPVDLAPSFQLSPVVFRRTFACLALIDHALNPSSGWDLRTLQEALGHGSLSTTQTYLSDVERYLNLKRGRFNAVEAAKRAAARGAAGS